jgi:hypothetical protein
MYHIAMSLMPSRYAHSDASAGRADLLDADSL